jgi:hypothetical protein
MAGSQDISFSESGSGFNEMLGGGLDQLSSDVVIWENLKSAIASSSGFQRWQLERDSDSAIASLTLDLRVRRYLRETLETLAY